MTDATMPNLARRRLLVGTAAHNTHVQNMVRALYEADALYAYFSGGVDVWHGPTLKRMRTLIGGVPQLDRELSRRAVSGIPEGFVRPRWRWELPRALAGRLTSAPGVEDWLWERGEHDLSRRCADAMREPGVDGFFGVEHGALDAVRAAKSLGKSAVVAFLSPHGATRARWVDSEFLRHPELSTSALTGGDALSIERDARRDEEARLADWIVSGSSFTTRSLVDSGIPAPKIVTVPLGGPDPAPASALPAAPPAVQRFIYAGPISVRKGAHYLLRAWRSIAAPGVELHFYGKCLLPDAVIAHATSAPGGDRLIFHGSVPASRLREAYLGASLLVLPTLCDGFGQVVSDALACGLPVITTHNAGAADAIDEGTTGFVIPPADEAALAERLAWCATHRDELFAMRACALSRAAHWTWADFRRTFAGALTNALDAPVTEPGVGALA